MAAACALALAAALALPGGDRARADRGRRDRAATGPAAQARYASAPGTAGDCTDANEDAA